MTKPGGTPLKISQNYRYSIIGVFGEPPEKGQAEITAARKILPPCERKKW
ncbi:protein of unknown function [Ruminococcaceae bacterium BL-6]|nr:protein of unknown function [Ruminococcaceae bacterium BL-6]